MKKKKILIVASEPAAGMVPYVATICSILENSNQFDLFVIAVNSRKRNFNSLIKVNQIQYVQYPNNQLMNIGYKFYPSNLLTNIKDTIKEHEIDLVHFISGDYSVWSVFKYLKIKNIKIVYTIHDLKPHASTNMSPLGKILHNYVIHMRSFIQSRADILTTSSISQFEEMKLLYKNKSIVYTRFPSLITEEIIRGNETVKELNGISNYILFFGNVDYYKGVDILVDSFINSSQYNSRKLVIAGKGLDFKSDANIIRINRFINDSEIKSLFRNADVVVYPYRSATMSGVLSLAYYFGRKVFASSIPFFRENPNDEISYFKNNIELCSLLNQLNSIKTNFDSENYLKYYSPQNLLADYIKLYNC